jgi:hypothetical protein
MQCRKSPCRTRFLVVDDNERRNRICNGEAAKDIDRDIRVMGAQIP